MDKKEVEIRYSLQNVNIDQLKQNLDSLGWSPKTIEQNDTYFCLSTYKESGQTKSCPFVLRLRSANKTHELSYKSFTNDGSWVEYETKIEDIDQMKNILAGIGMSDYLKIDKTRLTGSVGDIEINIDQIKGLGNFIEFELFSNSKYDAVSTLESFASKMGLMQENIITKGYVQLMEDSIS